AATNLCHDVYASTGRLGKHPEQRDSGCELPRDYHLPGRPLCGHHGEQWNLPAVLVPSSDERCVLAEPCVQHHSRLVRCWDPESAARSHTGSDAESDCDRLVPKRGELLGHWRTRRHGTEQPKRGETR